MAKGSQTFYSENSLVQKMTLTASNSNTDESELSQYEIDAVGDIYSKEASP